MKKKSIWGALLSLVVTVAVLTVFGGIAVSADVTVEASGSCGDNITYTFYSDGVMEITGTGAMYDDTDCGANQPWKSYRNRITSVNISQGVTHIGDFAFYYCENLEDISIPSSVTSIGIDAFYYCKGMEVLTISDSVSSIGKYAFSGWSNLRTVNLPDSDNLKFNNIPNSCFSGCGNLKSINIPEGIKTIGSGAFSSCKSLETLTLPSTVNELNYASFCNSGLTTLTIPEGVTAIPEYCFNNCDDLETVILPDSISSIGPESFGYCTSLKEIVIPSGVTELPYAAFVNCESLESITLPDTLVTIGDDVFYNNVNLKSVDFPDSLTTIGRNAFANPSDKSNAGLESLVLPNSVTTLSCEEGFDCDTFSNTNISSLSLPGSIETIPYTAFSNNKNLQSVTFGEGTKVIEGGAFMYCPNITTVVIPKTVEVIGYQAFGSGSNMTDIYCYADPENLDISMYNGHGNYNDNTKFHVPAEYLDKYLEKFPSLAGNLVGDASGEIAVGGSTHLCGYKLSMGGNIGVNFYMTLGDDVLANQDTAYMQFTINGTTQTVKVSEAARDGSYYIFRCDTVAKEMTDTITAQMYLSEGNPDGDAYTYSVRDYAVYILNHQSSFDAKTIAVVKAMLNYGASAQKLFSYKTDNLANSILSDSDRKIPYANPSDMSFASPVKAVNGDISLAKVSLSLKTVITMKLYFAGDTTGVDFYIGDDKLTTSKSGNYTVVSVEGIYAQYLAEGIQVKAYSGETLLGSVSYAPMNYCYNALTSSESVITPELKEAVSALYYFNRALIQYAG